MMHIDCFLNGKLPLLTLRNFMLDTKLSINAAFLSLIFQVKLVTMKKWLILVATKTITQVIFLEINIILHCSTVTLCIISCFIL